MNISAPLTTSSTPTGTSKNPAKPHKMPTGSSPQVMIAVSMPKPIASTKYDMPAMKKMLIAPEAICRIAAV